MSGRIYPPPADGYPLKKFGGRVPKQRLYGSGPGLFGDGTYSGNIVQGGVTLQPQDYLLDGITPLTQCIVVTGAATVAPNAETGSAVAMGRNLVVIGSSAILTASTNAKGLVLLFDAGIYARSGACIHMDKLGKAGNFGNLTAYDLAPASLKAKISQTKHEAYTVLGEGAAGGAAKLNGNNPGAAAGALQTGGGATGYSSGAAIAGSGGKGGPCSGGAGSGGANSGASSNAGDHGGPGSGGGTSGGPSAGGAGDPVGVGSTANGEGAGGGLLMLFSPLISVASGCIVSADGASGGGGVYYPGGGAGGGCVVLCTRAGGYTNSGTVRAAGGAAQVSTYNGSWLSGAGGAGSVNVFQNAA